MQVNTNMFKKSVADGTPRDCSTNRCGSQADTAIIRDSEIQSGTVGPLGRTQGNGPIQASTMITNFMGGAAAPTNAGANATVGVEDNVGGAAAAKSTKAKPVARGNWVARQLTGLFGGGGTKTTGSETNVKATAGTGASQGLPTCADDGTIEMVFHQVRSVSLFLTLDSIHGVGRSARTNSARYRSTRMAPDHWRPPSTAHRAARRHRLSRRPR
jgi:hypothetical protein